jgi:transposase-like protein
MLTLAQMLDRFQSEDDCYAFVTKLRWPNGVTCPKCGSEKVYRLNGGKGWKWVCKQSHAKNGYRFSPLVATIFENTNIPLRTWFQCILHMCRSKKGVSALQIQHTLGLGSYKSAWYMCHRIRAAMDNDAFTALMDEVEVDETYVGGRPENRHRAERKARGGKRLKVPVVAAISRKGKVVARVIEHADIPTLDGFVREVVSENVSLIATDEHWGYSKLADHGYRHETVKHRAGEYARGVVHTANLDSFWALLKRGIVGSYHQVSKSYLPFYLAEFTFRHNHRGEDLFSAVIAAC